MMRDMRDGAGPHPRLDVLEPRLLLSSNGFDFTVHTRYEVGVSPYCVATADVDGDGHVDLVTANRQSDTLSVLKNRGDGTFAAQVTYAVGGNPEEVTAADFDGDGNVDLAAPHWDTVSVLRNQGDGTFANEGTYTSTGHPETVAAADVDGDGHVDLITSSDSLSWVSVLLNQGDGTFADEVTYRVDGAPRSLVAADMDGDGHVDLATANRVDTVSVLRNRGDGTFAPRVDYWTDTGTYHVAAADLDGDGHVDLPTCRSGPNVVSVLRNQGNGTFVVAATYDVGDSPVTVAAADVDGDGDVDLVTPNRGADSVSVLENHGDGTFADAAAFGVGDWPDWVAAADLDGDGLVDLVTSNDRYGTVSVLLNQGGGGRPSADAGPDQVVTDADGSGAEPVTLDGSGSSDTDGTIQSYVWTEGGSQIAAGANPTVDLAVGTHTITLTVTDDDDLTDSEQVLVELVPTGDEIGTSGSANDVAYDGSGNLHFAWFDWSAGDLKYSMLSSSSGQWSSPATVDQSSSEVGQYVSMAVDSSGRPGLAYYDAWNADLKYASYAGGSWSVEMVHSKNSAGMYPSLAYDGNDRPVIAYYVPTGGFLFVSRWTGAQWSYDLLDGEAPFAGGPAGTEDVGRYPSLAMDPSTGQWAVAYENTSTGVFKYAEEGSGGVWTSTTYDGSTQNGGGYVSLAFDGSNRPCISYYDSYPADLKYARRSGGTWGCQTVASKKSQGLYTSLWFEGSEARIAYWHKNPDNLVLASQSGGSWTFEALVEDAGREARVAFNPLQPIGSPDYLAASWYIGSSGDLGCGIVM